MANGKRRSDGATVGVLVSLFVGTLLAGYFLRHFVLIPFGAYFLFGYPISSRIFHGEHAEDINSFLQSLSYWKWVVIDIFSWFSLAAFALWLDHRKVRYAPEPETPVATHMFFICFVGALLAPAYDSFQVDMFEFRMILTVLFLSVAYKIWGPAIFSYLRTASPKTAIFGASATPRDDEHIDLGTRGHGRK